MRKIINIDEDWFFTKESITSFNLIAKNSTCEKVNLPHTWNSLDGQDGSDYYTGLCTYQKVLNMDHSLANSTIYIEFEGVNSVCEVLLDGKFIGKHEGGHSTFRFDITKYMNWGKENILTVKVDNSMNECVYPIRADYTFYGGIYRSVNIIAVNPSHFSLSDYGSTGIYITPKVEMNTAQITIEAMVDNPEQCEAIYTILDAQRNSIISQCVQASREKIVLDIINPILWNGFENPYLYSLIAQIKKKDEVLDKIEIPFGIRYFHINVENGFFLNGENYHLNGVCRHQDRENMGWAITKKEHEEDMELIKEIGATAIRLAHYQHDQHFYELCDKNGFIVWAEIPFISIMTDNEEAHKNARNQMKELIKQNYNHPSICFWGLQNEVAIGGESEKLYENVKDLNKLVKALDDTRITTSANLFYVDNDSELNYISDVVSYNLYLGWYNCEIDDFDEWLEKFHKDNPQVPLGISEYGCDAVLTYHSEKPERQDYTEEFQAYYHEKVWEIFKNKKFLWSTYIWNMFDFASSLRNEGGVRGRNNKGLVTYDRKIKKDAFYFYKAQWSDNKFVHICSKRFVKRVENSIRLKIYSNCNEITLWVNEELVGTKTVENKIVVFHEVAISLGRSIIRAESNCGCVDVSEIIGVTQADESYVYKNENPKRNRVIHWFEDNKTEEELFPKDYFSVRDKLGTILNNPETKSLVESYTGDIFNTSHIKSSLGMTLERILVLNCGQLSDEIMIEIHKKLSKIKK
ncbi:MAG: glycoside hydrolase family 2 protein [Candidatus Galacturonibacter soehngenii]|nr:glycoside hydrolase family 2 protein [Candidatus Galacturonibacter soehngenii]